MNRTLIVCVLVFVAPVFAEDKKPEPKGEPVKGKITYNDRVIPGGTVTFVSKDGKTAVAAEIAEDGSYKATVPAGEYRITVSTDNAKTVVKIPVKYQDVKTTPLVSEVKAGKPTQIFDIPLKD